jgi:hypothetical protein
MVRTDRHGLRVTLTGGTALLFCKTPPADQPRLAVCDTRRMAAISKKAQPDENAPSRVSHLVMYNENSGRSVIPWRTEAIQYRRLRA